jgi:hypothetical protein
MPLGLDHVVHISGRVGTSFLENSVEDIFGLDSKNLEDIRWLAIVVYWQYETSLQVLLSIGMCVMFMTFQWLPSQVFCDLVLIASDKFLSTSSRLCGSYCISQSRDILRLPILPLIQSMQCTPLV